jgi:hypothetical protein
MNKNIDFVIVSYKSFAMADLLIRSIHKYTSPYDYHIYLVDNSDECDLFEKYKGDKFTYLKGDNTVPQKRFPSQISSAHSHGLQQGIENGSADYICLLDVDTCFLNEWTEYVIPRLDEHLFVSHRWEESRQIARPMFLVTKREYCSKYKIDLSDAYQDSGGIFTKRSIEHNLSYEILINSYNEKRYQKIHAIDPGRKIIGSGEQAFVQVPTDSSYELVPFFWHYGRGTVLGMDEKWYELLGEYLK